MTFANPAGGAAGSRADLRAGAARSARRPATRSRSRPSCCPGSSAAPPGWTTRRCAEPRRRASGRRSKSSSTSPTPSSCWPGARGMILTEDRPGDPGLRPGRLGTDARLRRDAARRGPGAASRLRAANLRLWRSLTPAELRAGGPAQRARAREPRPAHPDDGRARPGAPAADRSRARRGRRSGREGALGRCRRLMFEFQLEATEGAARAGTLTLPHGMVETPAFMPVGTHGVVRGLEPRRRAPHRRPDHPRQHLPPASAPRRGRRRARWAGSPLHHLGPSRCSPTPAASRCSRSRASGGSPRTASSSRATSTAAMRTLTPERAMEIQWTLGADVAMAFDHVVPGQAPHALAREGMERTLRWLDRCKARHERTDDRPAARRPRRPSGPSSRAAPTTTSACARSRAPSRAGRGPASPSAGSRSASPSR